MNVWQVYTLLPEFIFKCPVWHVFIRIHYHPFALSLLFKRSLGKNHCNPFHYESADGTRRHLKPKKCFQPFLPATTHTIYLRHYSSTTRPTFYLHAGILPGYSGRRRLLNKTPIRMTRFVLLVHSHKDLTEGLFNAEKL